MAAAPATAPAAAPPFDFVAAWARVNATPSVCRNPDLGAWQRRAAHAGEAADAADSQLLLAHNPLHVLTKRPTSTAAPDLRVVRAFAPASFHFGKASAVEVVAVAELAPAAPPCFAWVCDEVPAGADAAAVAAAVAVAADDTEDAQPRHRHRLFININPLFLGHALFVPSMARGLPQVATAALVTLGVRLAALFAGPQRRPDFSCGFNSLAAFSSVNHFHLHTIFAREVGAPDGRLPCEAAPRGRLLWQRPLTGGVALCAETTDWIVPGLVFSVAADGDGGGASPAALDEASIVALGAAAGALVERLAAADVAYHFLVCDGGRCVHVLPRQKQRTSFDGRAQIALMEVVGVAILNEASAFDLSSPTRVREGELVAELRSLALSAAELDQIAAETVAAEAVRMNS